jgi:type IV pilus assembly protein PilW
MTADAVTTANWPNVVSVRISLLVQSPEDNLVDAPQTYTFNSVTTTPADRRLRHVFTSTIGLRNRTL